MLNQENIQTVCTQLPECVHTSLNTQADTHRTVYYWNDGSLYWLLEGEDARTAERYETYGQTFKTKVPNNWSDEQITAHLQTVCTQSEECVRTPAHG
jgi:hypothetical protein